MVAGGAICSHIMCGWCALLAPRSIQVALTPVFNIRDAILFNPYKSGLTGLRNQTLQWRKRVGDGLSVSPFHCSPVDLSVSQYVIYLPARSFASACLLRFDLCASCMMFNDAVEFLKAFFSSLF